VTLVRERMDPATRLVRSLPGEWYKLSEAAEMLGCHEKTLRSMITVARDTGDKSGAPSKYVTYGKKHIYLYSPADIERIRGVLAERTAVRPFETITGRPPVYTPEERTARTKLSARAWYYRSRIKKLEAEGAARKVVADAKRKLREIEAELKRTEKP
jgi:hypothetical protein